MRRWIVAALLVVAVAVAAWWATHTEHATGPAAPPTPSPRREDGGTPAHERSVQSLDTPRADSERETVEPGAPAPQPARHDTGPMATDATATLIGRVHPAEIVGRLRRLAGLDPDGIGDGSPSAPGVRLFCTMPDGTEQAFPADVVALGAGGVFRIRGVPPAAWSCELVAVRGGGSGGQVVRMDLGPVGMLQPGGRNERTFDASAWVPTAVRAEVFENGAPLRSQRILLRSVPSVSFRRGSPTSMTTVWTDGEGRFEAPAFMGRVGVRIGTFDGRPTVDVPAGDAIDVRFDFESGALRFRGLRADGTSVARLRVVLVGASEDPAVPDRRRPRIRLRADESGVAAIARLQPGRYDVRVPPSPRSLLHSERDRPPPREHTVATVLVVAGRTIPLDTVLPAKLGY